MSKAEWEEERKQLLERLQKVEQAEQDWRKITAQSQAEAAVYLDLLKNCNEAARQARDSGNIEYLNSVRGYLMFYATPRADGEEWGKYFLDAYMRDASWLEDTKKALKQIKAEAEKLLEDNKTDAELKKKIEKIIAVADEGLITHV